MTAPLTTDLVGKTLGSYTLESLLGQGGFAWVFLGRETGGETAAVKVLKPRYAGDPQFESRFRNEAQTAAKLEHPNIIRIRSVGKDGRNVFYTMDYCPDSLGARLAREGPLSEATVLPIAKDVVRALGFAHAQGIIHRDIKPDNVLLRDDGRAVLTDFGIARAVSGYAASTGHNMTIGTPQYLSPEQAQGRELDQRVDFYALGVTLYKAVTGEVPFNAADWFELARMHVEDPPPSLRKKRPDISKRFERVVVKCLAKHPDDRYPSAVELLADLEAVGNEGRPTNDIGTAPTTSIEFQAVKARATAKERGPVVLFVILGVLLIVAIAVVIRLMR
ncbi:MAG TPA: serine/threonine-protein kinase [Gemmatimonadales bacterium]|nr:serine/threonine-protein kinase [Gemmatimonadales bacterium]